MTKKEFLATLKRKLRGLPYADIKERLSFYSEIIDDKMEEGLTEGEAVSEIGDINEIAEQILGEVEVTAKGGKAPASPWQIVLFIIGAPVWLPLLISFYAVMWSVAVVLWAIEIPMFIFAMISKGLIAISVPTTTFMAKLTKKTFCAIANVFRR